MISMYMIAIVELTVGLLPCRSCSDNEILSMLTYLITHGNTTVYQWEHGEIPPTVEQVRAFMQCILNSNLQFMSPNSLGMHLFNTSLLK